MIYIYNIFVNFYLINKAPDYLPLLFQIVTLKVRKQTKTIIITNSISIEILFVRIFIVCFLLFTSQSEIVVVSGQEPYIAIYTVYGI